MNVATSTEIIIPVRDYALATTLCSGQAFRWTLREGAWEGVVGSHWVQLRQKPDGLAARTAVPVPDWHWLTHYLQTEVAFRTILDSFPQDAPMRASVAACPGLRLLRQEPWECLASFIASSTKQIVQIQQIVALLAARYGTPVVVPDGHPPAHAFPAASRVAQATDADLRACKLGFRAPYLLAAARAVAEGALDLAALPALPAADARHRLQRLPGVGEKIANCVLLFAYGVQEAFPVDVWVQRALRQLYFPRRQPSRATLARFISSYFGPNAGYAQQYLFSYVRLQGRLATTLDHDQQTNA
jgi:N-glycosylase/DNA lyase